MEPDVRTGVRQIEGDRWEGCSTEWEMMDSDGLH